MKEKLNSSFLIHEQHVFREKDNDTKYAKIYAGMHERIHIYIPLLPPHTNAHAHTCEGNIMLCIHILICVAQS